MNQGLLSVDEALARLLAEAKPVAEVEEVPTLDATNRILARAQTLDHGRAADGQQRHGWLRGAGRRRAAPRVAQKIMAGARRRAARSPGTAARIFTGAPIPPGADAVVMQENTTTEGNTVRAEDVPAARRLDSPRRQRREEGRRDPAGGQAPAAAGHRTGGVGRHQDAAGVQESAAGPVLHRRRAGHARRAAARRGASTTPTASRCAGWASCSAASCTTTASCPTAWRRRARCCGARRPSAT